MMSPMAQAMRFSSVGRAKRSTSLTITPSTLTVAIPMPRPRAPIHRTEVVESLDDEIAADTLEEMSTEAQAQILEGLDGERAADILEERIRKHNSNQIKMNPTSVGRVRGSNPSRNRDKLMLPQRSRS